MNKSRPFSTKNRKPSGGPFLQPLVLAGVCLFLVALLLALAVVDLRALDKTLMAYVEKRGTRFIKTLQEAANANLERINQVPAWEFNENASSGLGDTRASVQENLVVALMQLAQHLDNELDGGGVSKEELATFTSEQGLWNLALFDVNGKLLFQQKPVDHIVRRAVFSMIREHGDLKIHLFDTFHEAGLPRFLALRRKHHNGFLVLFFDQRAFTIWRVKTVLEMAADAVGFPFNTRCLLIKDDAGVNLFQWGDCTDAMGEQIFASGASPKESKTIRAQVFWEGRNELLMVEKMTLSEGGGLTTLLRFNTESLARTVQKERRWRMIAMGFMVFMAVLSMWFLYRNQNRHLAKLQQMEKKLHGAERLSAMGRLASGVAHEIRNPLNAISMACQRLRVDNLDRISPVIRSEIRRLNAIVEDFLGLSKARHLKLARVDLTDVVKQVALLMGEEARSKGVEIRTQGTEAHLMTWLDESRIKQALINMVKNAMDAIKGVGSVTIEVGRRDKSTAVVSISDTGAGVALKDMDRIFNLDFTTKEQGLGLGLALAHEIIQAHEGEIRVESDPGVGTRFMILLPVTNGNRKR